MQQAILPQHFPDTADFSMQACMHPARELGGDFYDCFALSDGRWGFLVADVAGKGVGAASGGSDRLAAYKYEIGGFCGAVRTGTPLKCGPERALASARACIAGFDAIDTKTRIEIKA
jgi:hypothetical protein